ncbi:MAG: hypothetical protein IJ397_04735 [Lachnospiraceae bacterium]|nr:hypothetical protein [Lachnospiraceae bacterium]
MEYQNERDFKYVMQDTSHVFMGGRMTYDDMMTWEDTPFKIKAIVSKYFLGKEEDGLAVTLAVLQQNDFRYQILKQLKVKIKAGTYQTKKNLFGKEESKYVSRLYSLDEYMEVCSREKALITEEFVFSKLALLAFSL